MSLKKPQVLGLVSKGGTYIRGAMFGAVLGAAVSVLKDVTSKKKKRTPLPVPHTHLQALASDLVELYQDYLEFGQILRGRERQIFFELVKQSITCAERLTVIEQQVELTEIVANYHHYQDGETLALAAMEKLRLCERLFYTRPELALQLDAKGSEIATLISNHLQNIGSDIAPPV